MFRNLIARIDDYGILIMAALTIVVIRWPLPDETAIAWILGAVLVLIVLRRIRWMIEDHAAAEGEA